MTVEPDEQSNAEPPPNRSLTRSIYEHLGLAIAKGIYGSATDFPTEGEIARSNGVSRTVVREATKMLAAKGLLVGRPKRGTSVVPRTHWNLLDGDVLRWMITAGTSAELANEFFKLRLAVEPQAAKLAAKNRTILEAQRLLALTEGGDGEHSYMRHRAVKLFHDTVLEASANPFLAAFQRPLAEGLAAWPERLEGERRSYVILRRLIAEAIARGEGEAASTAMRTLLLTGAY